ncbi:MAG: hypothetical protein OXN88_00030 [Chloroflexota bacterium]|nr:hypothetical protein [Chloroflexota bacterium]
MKDMGERNASVIKERDLWRNRYLWETRRKRPIESLLQVEDGQYMAIESLCHSCEHLYSKIYPEQIGQGSVMQKALESVIRLYDHHHGAFLKYTEQTQADDDSQTFTIIDDVMDEHHGRQLAFYIREFLINRSKHESFLETTTENVTIRVLFNDEKGPSSATFTSTTTVNQPEQTGEINLYLKASRVIRALIRGIDLAYETYLDSSHPDQYKRKFSPATCSCSYQRPRNAINLLDLNNDKDKASEAHGCVRLSATLHSRVIAAYGGLSMGSN